MAQASVIKALVADVIKLFRVLLPDYEIVETDFWEISSQQMVQRKKQARDKYESSLERNKRSKNICNRIARNFICLASSSVLL